MQTVSAAPNRLRLGLAVVALATAYYFLLLYAIGYGMTFHWPEWWYSVLPEGEVSARLWLVVLHTTAVLIAAMPTALLCLWLLPAGRVVLSATAALLAVITLNLPVIPELLAASWSQHPVFLLADNLECLVAVPLLVWLLRGSTDHENRDHIDLVLGLVRDNLLPECPGEARRATSRAAGCMTSALYEIALENDKASHAVSPAHDDHVESKGEAAEQAAAKSSP